MENKIQKQINKLSEKCKNKRVLIYGAGRLCVKLMEHYDFSKFNIVGVCDKRFKENSPSKFFDFNSIKYNRILDYEYDIVLILLAEPNLVKKDLKKMLKTKKDISYLELKNITLAELERLHPNNSIYPTLGKNNKIIIVDNGIEKECDQRIEGLRIDIIGCNNTIKLHKPFGEFMILAIAINGNNSYIEIKENCVFEDQKIIIFSGESQRLTIGAKSRFRYGRICLAENSSLVIGEECMFAANVEIKTSDHHTIFDINSKKILNKCQKCLTIGNHVWLCENVHILKNASLPNNCIVGANTVIAKKFKEDNTIIAGAPAKVVKKNVNWSIYNPYYYEKEVLGKK